MARHRSLIEHFSFGGRVPGGVGLVLALTLAISLTVAFGERHALALFELVPLVPTLVWRGQVWRVVTWVFIEPAALSLLARCLLLYWLGRDLAAVWGSRRFLSAYFGTCAFAAVVTCVVALVDADVRSQTYLGSWPLGAALTVAWGLKFPHQVIRIYFVIPVRGYVLAWGTVGLTVAYSIFSGWERFVPMLAAQAAMLAWMFRGRLRARWLTYRLAKIERELETHRRDDAPLTIEEQKALKRALARSSEPRLRSSDLN